MRLQRRHGRIQNRRLVVRRAVHGRLDHRLVPHDAVAEFDAVDPAVRDAAAIDRIRAVITDEGDLLAAALEFEHHVVANPVAHHVRIGDARTEAQRVHRSQPIQVVDAVLAIPAVEYVGVVARAARQEVVAGAAGQGVVAEVSP